VAKAFLVEVSRDKDAFAGFVAATHVDLGRLLEAAAPGAVWDALPLSFLIEVLPRLQPRYYSISSSSIIAPCVPAITALVSSTPLAAALIPGLTTNYLFALSNALAAGAASLHPAGLQYKLDGPDNALSGARLYAHVRRSKFKLPMQSAHPIVMVSAGTGLAPFRAFLAERARLLAMGRDVGQMVLFFGRCHPDEDYIYREELEALEREMSGRLRIVTAFSRVQGQDKVYVQNRVRQEGREVCQLLEKDGALYIYGRASMAREVGTIVGELMGVDKGWEEPQRLEQRHEEESQVAGGYLGLSGGSENVFKGAHGWLRQRS
jgi:NADPH-ferrihemoprotein reductase